jgi:hypothetical protein
MQLIPKNWDVFQHYKDRCPPWIKLHRDLLNNRDFISLPLASKALAPMLWLLASESKDGVFDASTEELVFRLRLTESEVMDGIKPLINKGFFTIASGVLADRKQDAIPETERETEKRESRKPAVATKVARPPEVSDQVWDDWLQLRRAKKAPVTQTVLDGAVKEASKANISLNDFLELWVVRGSQGFQASWIKPNEVASKKSMLMSGGY